MSKYKPLNYVININIFDWLKRDLRSLVPIYPE